MTKDHGRRSEVVGQVSTAICGGALALCVLLVIGLMGLLAVKGMAYFWPRPLVEFALRDGSRVLGEVVETDRGVVPGETDETTRLRVKTGNRDLTGADFRWIREEEIVGRSEPKDALLLERLEWGPFYGRLVSLRSAEKKLADSPEAAWRELQRLLPLKRAEFERIKDFERGPIGDVNREIEALRLQRRALDLEGLDPARLEERRAEIDRHLLARRNHYEQLARQLTEMRSAFGREAIELRASDGASRELPLGQVVRALRVNEMGIFSKLGLYASRIWEFLSDEPRESNTEGGIFPAIFGTVAMVFLMSFAVSPLGVLAAIYLREYAKDGPLVQMVRIAVNNLAGVPSIVFGVFGLGFFVYIVGGTIDKLFYAEALPTPTFGTGGILWGSLTLALLTVPVVIVAAEEGLAAVPRIVREGSLALGATKFETISKVVVPAAAPGILTGMILAMARAAGEVAPLMIVGMVKLAPDLPFDGHFPFVHLERKFMHLGFHIYDLGFQSPNVEAAKPLVYATALLLVLVVVAMNLLAVWFRNRLRRKYASSAV